MLLISLLPNILDLPYTSHAYLKFLSSKKEDEDAHKLDNDHECTLDRLKLVCYTKTITEYDDLSYSDEP